MSGRVPFLIVHEALINGKPAGAKAFWMPGEIPGVVIGALIENGYRLVHESDREVFYRLACLMRTCVEDKRYSDKYVGLLLRSKWEAVAAVFDALRETP